MNRKLPPEAFDFYARLGPRRSYESVAKQFGVSRSSVAAAASREGWRARLEELERKAREELDKRSVNTMVEMRERHAKLGRLMQGQGANALLRAPIMKSSDAIRAIARGIEEELRATLPPERHEDSRSAQGDGARLAKEIRQAMKAAAASVPPAPGS